MSDRRPILFCYDRSEAAKAALAGATQVFDGRSALVLTVFESMSSSLVGAPLQRFELAGDVVDTLEELAEGRAKEIAAEGVELARAAGLEAEPLTLGWSRHFVQREPSGVAGVIARTAEERDVAAVVLGSRGASGVLELALGSVAYAVLHISSRPVLMVPAAIEGRSPGAG
jgi:nucleotide-binding universal stress UspA family protein